MSGLRPSDEQARKVGCQIAILALPATVFGLLTLAEQMRIWLAADVKAEPRPGGAFRLAEPGGLWVEGVYCDVSPHRTVVFTWGGIEGLKIGQSIVKIGLHFDGRMTSVLVCHSRLLSEAALDMHRFGWENIALPKLKAVAEGKAAAGTYLGEVADRCEHLPYLGRFCC